MRNRFFIFRGWLGILASFTISTGCSCSSDLVESPSGPVLCVAAGATGCAPDGSVIDWGAVPQGSRSSMALLVSNTSAHTPLTIERVIVTDQLGASERFKLRLCDGSCDGAGADGDLVFPVVLEPGAQRILDLVFDASTSDGIIPMESLEIYSDDSSDTVDPQGVYRRPFEGKIEGCREGYVDFNGEASDGCECLPSSDGTESCDGEDNDCDGVIDNDVPGTNIACDTGAEGVCGPGSTTCSSGVFACTALQSAGSEQCDGLDNDCDGTVDEDGSWSPYADGLSGGNMNEVVYDPRVPGTAYALVGNQIYRSSDSGSSFVRIGISSAGLVALAFPSSDPMLLLAASTDGLKRSSDGGATWSALSLIGFSLTAILVHPANPTHVYVGSSGGGILRSTNGGASFTALSLGVPFGRITSLVGDADDVETVVAGLITIDENGTWVGGTVVHTINGGLNWTTTHSDGNEIFRIRACATDSKLMYAATFGGGLMRSQDGGLNWAVVGFSAQDVVDVALAPADCATVYASVFMDGIHRSTNGATDFSGPLAIGIDSGSIGTLRPVVDPANANSLLASNHSGAFFSTNGADSWVRVQAISAVSTRGLAISPTDDAKVWMTTWGQGLWTRSSPGGSWNVLNLPSDYGFTVTVDPKNADRIFMGGWPKLWQSSDGGNGFVNRSDPNGPGNTMAIRFHPNDPNIVYAATQTGGMWKSENGGVAWTQINTGLPAPWATVSCLCQDIRAIVIDPGAPDTIDIATNGKGVFRSTNGGAAWQASSAVLADESITCLEHHDGSLYACVEGKGLWKSTDGGTTFSSVTEGQAELNNAKGIFVDQTGAFFVTSDGGVFRSTDGLVWDGLDNACLPAVATQNPVVISDNGNALLLVGTEGAGVFALSL